VYTRTTCRSRTTGVPASTLCGDESQPVTKLSREAALISSTLFLETGMSLASTSLLSYMETEFRQLSLRHYLCMLWNERHEPLTSRCRLVPSCPFTSTATKLDFNEARSPNMVPDLHTIPVNIYMEYQQY